MGQRRHHLSEKIAPQVLRGFKKKMILFSGWLLLCERPWAWSFWVSKKWESPWLMDLWDWLPNISRSASTTGLHYGGRNECLSMFGWGHSGSQNSSILIAGMKLGIWGRARPGRCDWALLCSGQADFTSDHFWASGICIKNYYDIGQN